MTKYSQHYWEKRRTRVRNPVRERILKRDGYKCQYCGYDANQIDHVLPFDVAHDDSDNNLVACCDVCNRVASGRVFASFQIKREYILEQYGPFIEGRHAAWRKRVSVCSDCGLVFIPHVDGASSLLCASCYDEDDVPRYSRSEMKPILAKVNRRVR